MLKIINTLSRLGSAELSKSIGSDTISILESLDAKQVSSHNLADLMLAKLGPDGLLLEKSKRTLLIEALSQEDAQALCENLGVTVSDDPWDALTRYPFQRKSKSLNILFDFFECEAPDLIDQGDVSNTFVSVNPNYPLFEHQNSACRKVVDILSETKPPRALLHMPTGAGKTRTAMNVIAHFMRYEFEANDLVIWLAHSEELCEQAAEEFEKCWQSIGVRQIGVHRFFGDNKLDLDSVENGFLVAGLQIMFSKSQREQHKFFGLGRRTKLVVLDEAHQAIAPTYKHVLEILAANRDTAILGLSATPGRSTLDAHEDLKLAEFFNRRKVPLEVEGYASPVDYLQDQGYLAKADYERLLFQPEGDDYLTQSEASALSRGFDVPLSLLLKLGSNQKRNLLLLARILEECENPKSKIIVFACSVDHAHLISNILKVKGISSVAITGETRSDIRRDSISKFRDTDDIQVLSNYGVLTTGFDAPRTNVAVIARPTNSVVLFSQMVGRASRGVEAGGNETCKIITIVDELPGFRSVAEAFEYWDDIWE